MSESNGTAFATTLRKLLFEMHFNMLPDGGKGSLRLWLLQMLKAAIGSCEVSRAVRP